MPPELPMTASHSAESSIPAAAADAGAALPRLRIDYQPLLIIPLLALLALPLVGSFPTWVTLTIAGLAMGMMIFIMASGLTLIFGLMDVLNFGHGAFVSVGAFTATLVLLPMKDWVQADSLALNLAALGFAVLLAMLVTGALGWAFERIIIRPVYGLHLKQILITMGGMIVAEQMINVIWGAEQIPLPLPETFRGAFVFGDSAVEKYRLIAVGIGLAVFVAMFLVLNRTKIGLLIRAGVENSEMVEALGYRIRRLFVGVFVAGSALAGLGGVLWGLYKETLTAAIGGEITVLVFIVIIIGGLGSVGGCFIGALLVALVANYAGFLAPKVALVSDILLMVMVLLWRPQGLYPVAKR
jgi:branched-chain amino acid transport system permease protein